MESNLVSLIRNTLETNFFGNKKLIFYNVFLYFNVNKNLMK